MARLTLYTRKNCCLCDDAKEVLDRVRTRAPFELDVVDVDGDAELTQRYGWEVPVVLVDGKKWAKFRVDEHALERRLRAREEAR
jgi:glutaredoxin